MRYMQQHASVYMCPHTHVCPHRVAYNCASPLHAQHLWSMPRWIQLRACTQRQPVSYRITLYSSATHVRLAHLQPAVLYRDGGHTCIHKRRHMRPNSYTNSALCFMIAYNHTHTHAGAQSAIHTGIHTTIQLTSRSCVNPNRHAARLPCRYTDTNPYIHAYRHVDQQVG